MTAWGHARSVNGLFSAPSPAVPPPLLPSSTSDSELVPLGATSSSPCQIAAQPANEKDGEDDDCDMDDDDWETDEAILSNSVHGTYREWLAANVGDRIGIWKEKATRGVSWAQWLLARCFQEGIGVRQDAPQRWNGSGSPLNKNGPIYRDAPLHKPCWGAAAWMVLAFLRMKPRPSVVSQRRRTRQRGCITCKVLSGPLL